MNSLGEQNTNQKQNKKSNLIKIFDFQITIINNNYDFLLCAVIIYLMLCSFASWWPWKCNMNHFAGGSDLYFSSGCSQFDNFTFLCSFLVGDFFFPASCSSLYLARFIFFNGQANRRTIRHRNYTVGVYNLFIFFLSFRSSAVVGFTKTGCARAHLFYDHRLAKTIYLSLSWLLYVLRRIHFSSHCFHRSSLHFDQSGTVVLYISIPSAF